MEKLIVFKAVSEDLKSLFGGRFAHGRRLPVRPRRGRQVPLGIEGLEQRQLLSTGPVPNYNGPPQVWQTAMFSGGVDKLENNGNVYYYPSGSSTPYLPDTYTPSNQQHGRVQDIVPAHGGVVTLFQDGTAWYSPNGINLGGGGSTVKAYTGTETVVQIVPVGQNGSGGVDTLLKSGVSNHVFYSPTGTNLGGGGGGTVNAYIGSGQPIQLVAVNGCVDTMFSSGSAYFSTTGNYVGGGPGTVNAYNGPGHVAQIVAVNNLIGGLEDTVGVETRFTNGSVYFSHSGINLGGGPGTVNAYTGTGQAVQLVGVWDGVDARFNTGSVYFSPNGLNVGGGGSTVNAYTGTQKVVNMVAYEGGILTLFSGDELYFSPGGQYVGLRYHRLHHRGWRLCMPGRLVVTCGN
jgi:hypothetical protein